MSEFARVAPLMMLDAAAAEAVGRLEGAGVPVILIKGPVIAARLYDRPGERTYSDVDLLVAPSDRARAVTALTELGYDDPMAGFRPSERPAATCLVRTGPGPSVIDLQSSLPWYGGDPARLWSALERHARGLIVAGRTVRGLDDTALLLVIAGHAVQHALGRTTRADLERAIERVDRDTWAQAAVLAAELEVEDVLAKALQLVPSGTAILPELAERAAELSKRNRLYMEGNPPIARLGARLRDQRSLRGKAGMVATKLLPSPAFLRYWARRHRVAVPFEGRGPIGLAALYALRLSWLLREAPRARRAWRRSSTPRRGTPRSSVRARRRS